MYHYLATSDHVMKLPISEKRSIGNYMIHQGLALLLVTCKDKQPRAIQKCFQSVYLDITRMICVGYGPYRVDDLFPTGSTHGVIECKLDPKINAQYLRWLNAKMSRTSFVK